MWFEWFRSTPDPVKTVELASSYQSRSTRFPLDVLVSFSEKDRRHDGQCINVSESGLLARFDHPPELWTEGKIELETGAHYLSIHVRAARQEGNDIGFAFSANTPNDRAAIEILLDSVRGRLLVAAPEEMDGREG